MYHSIAHAEVDSWNLHVSPSNFEGHLRVIKKNFMPISLPDCLEKLAHKRLPPRTVVLTFDDGYYNNFSHALPLLEHYGIPATFFITTGTVDSKREFWWDELENLIFQTNDLELKKAFSHAKLPFLQDIDTVDPVNKDNLCQAVWNALLVLPRANRENVLHQLTKSLGREIRQRTSHRPLLRQELIELATSPIATIGAHTVYHPNLRAVDLANQKREIYESKACLENLLGQEITLFSYPFGGYGEKTPALVRELGFQGACSTQNRLLADKENPFLLPRIGICNWAEQQFLNKLTRQFGKN